MSHECGDLQGVLDAGPSAGSSESTLCLDTLQCLIATRCARNGLVSCYCGSLSAIGCADAGATVTGACAMQIANGLGLVLGDNWDILTAFNDWNLPAGMADQIMQCAIANQCKACTN